MFDRKGQIRTIEAFLAVSIIFSVVAFTSQPSLTPDFERVSTLKKLGTQVLIELDKKGTLGRLIEDGNWTVLEESVETLLPLGVFFNLTVYDEEMREVNSQHIGNCNSFQGRNRVSVQYLCVTRCSNVHFYTVRLHLAWAE